MRLDAHEDVTTILRGANVSKYLRRTTMDASIMRLTRGIVERKAR